MNHNLLTTFRTQCAGILLGALVTVVLPLQPAVSSASPFLSTGDSLLRSDVQLLADAGFIDGPVLSWPLAWGPVQEALRSADTANASSAIQLAKSRLLERAEWETQAGKVTLSASASMAESPTRIRGFQRSARDTAEFAAGLSWIGERFALSLRAQAIDPAGTGDSVSFDRSMLALAVGNYTVALSTLERWWGPGNDGSIILSNNARPVPAISIDRNFTSPFESRWLSWMGTWDLSVLMGQLEGDRAVPDALLFGMRFSFRPLRSLEIGLSRTAQWCGEGRSCSLDTFVDLLVGNDNRGGGGINLDNEPGNQLAGFDIRWSRFTGKWPFAVYGQFIGEDEAGGFPSRYLGQVGVETWGVWRGRWTWRWFGEYSGTACQFHEATAIFNCAYNHEVYQTGYRYEGRALGHAADNDAELFSSGLLLGDSDGSYWRVLLRTGELNRGGAADFRNSITPMPMDLNSIDFFHSRPFRYGVIEAGVGYENRKPVAGSSSNDGRVFVQWRSGY